ncbi:MAG: hypothetical protein Q7T82_05245 [Armatimonadota bacterium]|nr:hypothetical protein [Armatimonadota bacterium]
MARPVSFPLEVVGVHYALGDNLIAAEGPALAQDHIDQRRLTVVNVGYNGQVPHIFADVGRLACYLFYAHWFHTGSSKNGRSSQGGGESDG